MTAISRYSDNLLKSIMDPVTQKPFENAVSLLPCLHKLSGNTARDLYGRVTEGMVEKSGTCPKCKVVVTHYLPDPDMRAVVEAITGIPQATAEVEVIPDIDSIPYPGEGREAHFVLYPGSDWNRILPPINNLPVRKLTLISETPYSYLEKLCIMGYQDGDLRMQILLKGPDDEKERIFQDYFKALGFQSADTDCFSPSLCSETREELKKMFHLVANHNEIPEDSLMLIRALAESGDWQTVTPTKLPPPILDPSPADWLPYLKDI